MTADTAIQCSCGMMITHGKCPHCDTGTCPFCASFQYEKCVRNRQYNAVTTVRLRLEFPMIEGGHWNPEDVLPPKIQF